MTNLKENNCPFCGGEVSSSCVNDEPAIQQLCVKPDLECNKIVEEEAKIMENYITPEMAADDNFKNHPEAYDKANIVAADCCGYCEYYNASSAVCGFHKLYTYPTDVCSEFLKR